MVTAGTAVPKLSRRRAIVELAYYCAEHGELGGPVEQAVVEGRRYGVPGQSGSSCVELVDCCLFAAGCRAEAINRDEHLGRKPQRDLGWYLPGSKHDGSIIHKPRLEQLKPGDPCGYDFDRGGHAFIFLGIDEEGRAVTADYGQPGGRLYRCSVGQSRGMLTLRGRHVWAAVDADTLTYPEPALAVSEWCERHGLPVEPWMPAQYLADLWDSL